MPSTIMGQLLGRLVELLGPQNVISDDTSLSVAQSATFKTTQKIIGIAKAQTVTHVQRVMEIAGEYGVPLYVVSIGKNWGYGSRVPLQDGSLLLDLSAMNRILDYNEELGYVTVEPGVTQRQLHNFLEKKGEQFAPSTTGSAPTSSVIGNICERGVGRPPYSFRAHYVTSLEVVLPTGQMVHTGYGRFGNAQATKVYRDGVGPAFTDLFVQSNLGVITNMTLLLAPNPKYVQFIHLHVNEEQDMPKYLAAIRTFNLYANSTKPASFHNDLQILARKTQYPWDTMQGLTPLSSATLELLKRKYKVPYVWEGSMELSGFTEREITAQLAYFKSLTKGLQGVLVSPLYRPEMLDRAPANIRNGIYWRMKTKPPRVKNPDVDGCGNIRASIAVPYTNAHIHEVVETMRRIITQHAYEPFIEIHCLDGRWVIIVASLVFDRTCPGEDDKALQCHDELLTALMKQGYYPYRLNVHSMPMLPGSTDAYDDFQQAIKHAIDPDNILAPGRYEVTPD